ncbi:prefoldin subunit 5 isoform X2 [Neoarius graeffei]|uniref:prefoldin subunit 5 isoform X2 n=1 Tax=Neoarius graeffei TaxID=443677 RepID=UPI00298D0AD2|nr:prefoldin subunit 5 isoform X2 [Neoarius graeffei]
MAVNVSELSLPQLEGLKSQLDQETEFLSSSIAQLKVVQTKYVEAKDSLNVLKKSNEGKELLVPLTSSMYVPGTLNDVEHVLINVGTGYFVEKNVELKTFQCETSYTQHLYNTFIIYTQPSITIGTLCKG